MTRMLVVAALAALVCVPIAAQTAGAAQNPPAPNPVSGFADPAMWEEDDATVPDLEAAVQLAAAGYLSDESTARDIADTDLLDLDDDLEM